MPSWYPLQRSLMKGGPLEILCESEAEEIKVQR